MPEDPIAIRNLAYAYGRRPALADVSFSVARGRFTALLGPNGAGKTTLFALCLRLLAPPPGAVRIEGHDLAKAGAKALRGLGVVHQEPTLDLDLTVRQNLQYFAALRGMARKDAASRIEAGLATMGLADALDRKARVLSFGQRRRIEIVRAMLHHPTVLLLDEPTTGLDIRMRAEIVRQVHELAWEKSTTVLWATHLIDEIAAGDDVVILDRGRTVARGSVPEVLRLAGADSLEAAYTKLTAARAPAAA